MKIGFRKPSLKKSLAARTSVKRYIRHSLGFKAPRGYGWLTRKKLLTTGFIREQPSAWPTCSNGYSAASVNCHLVAILKLPSLT
ncbi:MAG: hypothetical protein RQ715_07595 [Methylococcales bacterium]|nr:hypothetical protein [Methylococcales bacterium]